MSASQQRVVNPHELHSKTSATALAIGVVSFMAMTSNIRDAFLAAVGAAMGASAANAPVVCIFATAAVSYAIVSNLLQKVG